MQTQKQLLSNWCIKFFCGNVVLFWLLGLIYLSQMPWMMTPFLNEYGKGIAKIFTGFAYIGHLGLLALLPGIVPWLLLWVLPFRRLIISIAIVVATLAASFLMLDIAVYKLYRFHLNGIIISLATHGLSEEVFGFAWREYLSAILVISGILLLEIFYARRLWRRIREIKSANQTKWLFAAVMLCLYISYAMIIYSAGWVLNRVFIDVAHCLPLYSETLGLILPIENGRIVLERGGESNLIQPHRMSSPLNYPTAKLNYIKLPAPKNLVIIAIDAWRFDMLNAEVMPNLSNFSKQAWVFTHHFSGGNATGPGIFSLFYGLPTSYWTAMEMQHRGPVLLDELIQRHYQLGVFSSATLRLPNFNQTVFSAVANLKIKTPGATPYDRDTAITAEFKQFIAEAVKRPEPFFSFLFYDSSHSYCAFAHPASPFQPAIEECNRLELTNESDPVPYLNRYKNAVFLVDQQIKQVLAVLRARHLLDNTVVIVTGDHGEEFNDNHVGYWGHASNFTRYQVQTPLIIYWPHTKPQVFTHATSHFDIAPTLMHNLLGCTTAPQNYSLGKSLFDTKTRPYLIVGSYVGLGVIESDRITSISQTGNFLMQQLNGAPAQGQSLNIPTMQHVFSDLHRFYRNTPSV